MTKLVQKLGTQRTADMIDVLISCSRKDIEFTQRLHHELEAQDHEPVNLCRGSGLGVPPTVSAMANGQIKAIGNADNDYSLGPDSEHHSQTYSYDCYLGIVSVAGFREGV